ncbi:uncharacterized protein [Amphiura filiformis]|uniref:uncharacterized protein n=1 Tax=Amphiura filiformis TaxID=82378 RepID=UPI003B224DC3
MDQATSSGYHFDFLPDDVLIIIFSFLTLYERLLVMRAVSKRYHRILSNPQVWTHVDFWQEQQLTEKQLQMFRPRIYGKTWMFLATIESVLDFLKKYTSGSLKSIYLKFVNKDILKHLKTNCGNLEIVSFLSARDAPNMTAINWHEYIPLHEIMPMPKTLKVCSLSFKVNSNQWQVLHRLAQCKNLRRLTIHGLVVSAEVCVALSQLTELSVLNMYVTDVQTLSAMLPLGKLTNLKTFKFSNLCSFNVDIDQFLFGIVDKWQGLKCLGLAQIDALSSQTFALVTSLWTQLQVLELQGKTITDGNIALIAKHLKKLKTLKLLDGDYTPLGIRVLCGHPSIERLYLLKRGHQHTLEWLLDVYDVILSLPTIVYVKLTGYELKEFYRSKMHVKIPEVSTNVQIEVKNISQAGFSYFTLIH